MISIYDYAAQIAFASERVSRVSVVVVVGSVVEVVVEEIVQVVEDEIDELLEVVGRSVVVVSATGKVVVGASIVCVDAASTDSAGSSPPTEATAVIAAAKPIATFPIRERFFHQAIRSRGSGVLSRFVKRDSGVVSRDAGRLRARQVSSALRRNYVSS